MAMPMPAYRDLRGYIRQRERRGLPVPDKWYRWVGEEPPTSKNTGK